MFLFRNVNKTEFLTVFKSFRKENLGRRIDSEALYLQRSVGSLLKLKLAFYGQTHWGHGFPIRVAGFKASTKEGSQKGVETSLNHYSNKCLH